MLEMGQPRPRAIKELTLGNKAGGRRQIAIKKSKLEN